ncbi:MAG: GAF domain-containing protein, partial [Anaerolineae bacterium]
GLIGGAADPASPSFAGILSALRPPEVGHADLLDRDGMVLTSTDLAHVSKESGHKTCLEPMFREEKATVGTYPHIEAGVEKWKDVVAFAPLSAAPWGVSIEQPESEALALVYHLRERQVATGVVALVVALLLTWVSTQSTISPLRQLLAASRRIATGDLATPVPPLGEDEVGELGRAFDEMRQRLARWGEELEAAVQQRTRELAALYAIDRAAAQSLDLDEILNDSLDKTLEVLGVEAGGILLMEPDGETMTLRVHRGLSEEFAEAVRHIKLGEGISGQAAAQQKPVVLDVAEYPSERLAPFIVKEGFQTIASTPLMAKGRALGAMTLGTYRPRAFPPGELELLTAIGQQLGQAVENAQLYEAEQRRREVASALLEIAKITSSTLELTPLLKHIALRTAQVCRVNRCTIFLLDETREYLQPIMSQFADGHADAEQWQIFKATTADRVDAVPLFRQAVRERRPSVLEDTSRTDLIPLKWTQPFGIQKLLTVPLVRHDRAMGLMALDYTDTVRGFTQEQIDLAMTIGSQVAASIENARLYEETQRRASEMTTLNQVGRALATTLHLDEVAEVIYQEVTTVMEAAAFFVALYDQETDELDYLIRVDQGVREPPERRPAAGLSGLIVTSGQPILIRNFAQEKEQHPQAKLWGTMEAPDSWLGVPMKVGERVVGVISVQAYRPQAYDEGHQALLSTMADMAALAVDNARQYAAEERRAVRLAQMVELGAEL